jgi:nucleoside phosphorylase
MPGIPDNLHLRLRAALMDLDEFADNDTLRNVMQNSRLRPWRNRLRDTMNRATRAKGAVAYLQNQYTCDPRENALVILLRTLAGRREPENAEYLDLVALAAELERAQTGPVPIVATPSLSDEDRALVRDVLLRCDEFDSDAQLRTLLGGELLPFRDRMPEASTRVGRVENAINYLQDKEVRGNRNALAVLLRALAGRYHPADTRAAALQRAALLVEFGGARAGELGVPSVGEETSMPTFDQRGQHVGQQYNVAGNLHIGTVQPRGADATRGTAVPPPVDVVIITPLEEERDAVLAKLAGHRQLPPTADDIRVYFAAELPVTFPDGATATYQVVVVPLLNMGRVEAATATGDAIRRWRPRYVWLVGIAGGLAKAGVALGDVLIADQIADYELQKLTPEATSIRWQVHRVDPRLLGAARNLRGDGWRRLITCARPDAGPPRRHIGAICTGDKVIANGLLDDYREVWAKLVGVEMEAGGTASAAFQAATIPGFFMVRGVSDLADAAKDSGAVQQWRAYACDVAAAYAIGLLQSGPVPLVGVEGADRPR